jgi:hypothetical protein
MTEEQAKTKKVCPFLVIGWAIDKDGVSANCEGSDCMMWVWDASPETCAKMNAQENAQWVPDGHCGLVTP